LITAAPLTDVRPTPKDDSPNSGITTRDFSCTVHSTVNPPHANKTTHADNVEHPNFDDKKPLAVNMLEVLTNKPDDTRVSWRGLTLNMSRLVPGNQPPLGTPVVCQKTTHLSDAHSNPNAGHPTRTLNLRTFTGTDHHHAYYDHGDDDYDDYNNICHNHSADHSCTNDPRARRPPQQQQRYNYGPTTTVRTPRTPLTGQMTLERFLAQQQQHPYNSKDFSRTTNIPAKHTNETWSTWYVRFSLHGLLHGVFVPPWELFAKDKIYGAWYGDLPPTQLDYIHGVYGLFIQSVLCQKFVLPDDSKEWQIARNYTDGYEILYAMMTPYHPITTNHPLSTVIPMQETRKPVHKFIARLMTFQRQEQVYGCLWSDCDLVQTALENLRPALYMAVTPYLYPRIDQVGPGEPLLVSLQLSQISRTIKATLAPSSAVNRTDDNHRAATASPEQQQLRILPPFSPLSTCQSGEWTARWNNPRNQ
jgi:hypothetical protein